MSTVERTTGTETWKGISIPRKEDGRLVQGQGQFVDDRRAHGAGFCHFVRSPYGHATIVSIDVEAALLAPGVLGVLTPDEVVDQTDPFFQIAAPPGALMKDYCLAVGKARHMGEPVVAVVAVTREQARDAADLVEIEYEPLEAVVETLAARDPRSPLVHEEPGTNLTYEGKWAWGDCDAAFAEADAVVKIDRLHFHRFTSTPLECAGALVDYDEGTELFTIQCNHQMPGVGVVWMAPALRVPFNQLRLVTGDIGGGFGNKITYHPYLVALCLLARKLHRPIHWTETRTEQHLAGSHGNERTYTDIEVGVRSDGEIIAVRGTHTDNCGAYPRYEPLGCVIWSQVVPGNYRVQNVDIDFAQVVSNKAPCGPNRGYSRMQHLWFMERVVDIVATRLELDPVDVRKLNYVRAEDMPYTTPNGCVYDSGDYARCLDIALDLIGYDAWRERQAAQAGTQKVIGIGIGSTLDSGTNNFGQSQLVNPELQFSGNNESATARMEPFGDIVVTLGTVPQGQGHETTSAQVVADVLGVTPDQVIVRRGSDTWFNNTVGFSGTYASQFAVTGLVAVKGAADALSEEIRRVGAAFMGASGPEDMELVGGMVGVIGDEQRRMPITDVAGVVQLGSAALPPGLEDVDLNCRYTYRPQFSVPDKDTKYGNLTLTYAAQIHACVVEIDRETGETAILDYAAVDDCGTRIHPQIVEGQVHGAWAHGLGGALWENLEYSEDGTLLTANFYDYHVPHAMDLPDPKGGHIESPSPFTPLGAKGMGEGGGGAVHAMSAAVQDALRSSGLTAIVDDSHTNAERVWRLFNEPDTSAALVEVVRT